MRKLYQETFGKVRASGRLRTEVMSMTELERRPPKRRLPKAALIAAILALALAGTAVAAELLGLTVNFIEDPYWNEDGSPVPGFKVLVERDFIPVERLSDELRDLAAETGDGMHWFVFPSWNEAAALWNLELRSNPMLHNFKTMGLLVDGETQRGQCFLSISCNGGELMWSNLKAQYSVYRRDLNPVPVYLEVNIVTNNSTGTLYENALNAGHLYNADPDQIVQSSEAYTTPSGLEAVLVTTEFTPKWARAEWNEAEPEEGERSVKDRETCAFFVWDDVLYTLSIWESEYTNPDPDFSTWLEDDAAASTLLKEILDAYE